MISEELNYRMALGLGIVTLLLAVSAVVADYRNRQLQDALQEQVLAVQAELVGLREVEGISHGIFEDLGRAAITNVEIRVLMARHGYTLVDGTAVPPEFMPALDEEIELDGLSVSPEPDAAAELVLPEIVPEDVP